MYSTQRKTEYYNISNVTWPTYKKKKKNTNKKQQKTKHTRQQQQIYS